MIAPAVDRADRGRRAAAAASAGCGWFRRPGPILISQEARNA